MHHPRRVARTQQAVRPALVARWQPTPHLHHHPWIRVFRKEPWNLAHVKRQQVHTSRDVSDNIDEQHPFAGLHALCKLLGGIPFEYVNDALSNDGPGVVFGFDDVHRCARLTLTCGNDGTVNVHSIHSVTPEFG